MSAVCISRDIGIPIALASTYQLQAAYPTLAYSLVVLESDGSFSGLHSLTEEEIRCLDPHSLRVRWTVKLRPNMAPTHCSTDLTWIRRTARCKLRGATSTACRARTLAPACLYTSDSSN